MQMTSNCISAEPNHAAAINTIRPAIYLLAIIKWMSNYFFKLNESKTKILLGGNLLTTKVRRFLNPKDAEL